METKVKKPTKAELEHLKRVAIRKKIADKLNKRTKPEMIEST